LNSLDKIEPVVFFVLTLHVKAGNLGSLVRLSFAA
jgi:hypothetical protein